MRPVLRNRIWALFILSAFMITQGGYAQQPAAIGEAISEGGQQVGFKPGGGPAVVTPRPVITEGVNPYNLLVPDKYGKVEEVFQGAQDAPMIVHIQDAHANYEAQLNIKQILSHLSKNYNINLIQLEGASSKLDPSVFETAYIKEANLKLADYLMREGRLSGAEAFAIESKESVELHGVENRMLYMENLRTFRLVYSHQEEINEYFKAMRVLAKDLRTKLLNEELLDLTRNMEAYAQERIDLLDYLLYLDKLASRHRLASLRSLAEIARFPNLVRILRMNDLEKRMNEAELKKEAAAIKNNFREKTRDPEVLELLASLELRKKGMKPRIYFRKLTDLAEKHGVDLLRYPQMRTLAEFLILQDEIEHHGLFVEVERLEKLIQKRLLRKKAERELIQLLKALELLAQYFKLEVNREKLAYIIRRYEQMRASQIKRELDQLAQKFDVLQTDYAGDILKIDQYMDEVEYFYRVVLERDRLFVENVLAKVKAGGVNRTVLITGGFHTDGLTALLRKQNISYAVVIPKVDVKQGNEKYVKIMMEEESEIGSVFAGTFAVKENGRDRASTHQLAASLGVGLGVLRAAQRGVLAEDLPKVREPLERFSAYSPFIDALGPAQPAEVSYDRAANAVTFKIRIRVLEDGQYFEKVYQVEISDTEYEVKEVDSRRVPDRVGSTWDINPAEFPGADLPAGRVLTGVPSLRERPDSIVIVAGPAAGRARTVEGAGAVNQTFPYPGVLIPGVSDLDLLRALSNLQDRPLAADRLGKTARDEQALTVELLDRILALVQVGPDITNFIDSANIPTQARKDQLRAFSSMFKEAGPLAQIVRITTENPDIAARQAQALLRQLTHNRDAVAIVYTNNPQAVDEASVGVDADVLKRLRVKQVADADEALRLVRRDVRGELRNLLHAVLGRPLPSGEYQRLIRALVPPEEEALGAFLQALIIPELISVLSDPAVLRDPELGQVVASVEPMAVAILKTPDEEKQFLKDLQQRGLAGIIVPLGGGRYSLGITAQLVQQLYTDYLAAVEVAIRA